MSHYLIAHGHGAIGLRHIELLRHATRQKPSPKC
jgi:hypothetical protein